MVYNDMGSIIIPQTQALGEELSISGTSMILFYFSDRVLGYKPILTVPLTAASIPASLKTVHLRVVIREKTFEKKFPPSPNLQYQFVWDRKDSYGRTVVGQVTAFINIGYEYGLVYHPVPSDFRSSFNRLSQATISRPVSRRSETAVFWEKRTSVIGNAFGPVEVAGLGSWSISAHHSYDPASGVLYRGDGKRTQFRDRSQVIETLAGNGAKRLTDCLQCRSSSLPAKSSLLSPVSLAVGADSSMFIGDYELIRRVDPGGNMTTVVNFSTSPPDFSYYIAISPVDGDLFMSYAKTRQIYRVKASLLSSGRSPITLDDIGKIPGATVFAGTGEKCHGWDESCGDDGLAVNARLSSPKGISVGSRSDVYFADGKVIRQVGVDGVISTFAGSRLPRCCSPPGCTMNELGNDDVELDRAYFDCPTDVVVQRDDESIYFVDGNVVYHLARDGRVRLVAGHAPHVTPELGLDDDNGESNNQFVSRRATSIDFNRLQGLAVWRDGSVYFTETDNRRINRVLLLDQDGFVNLIAGVDSDCDCRSCSCFFGDNQASILSKLSFPSAVALSPDGGRLYVADQGNFRVRMARISLPTASPGGRYVIPSDDGQFAFVFDFTGRHISTALSSSGEVIQTFDYEDFDTPRGQQGLLTAIRDAYNNSLIVHRASDGHALGLESSYGYRTTLEMNSDGYLSRIVDPTGTAVRFSYQDSEGLLASTTDPRNLVHTYQYDEYGRLIRDRQPDGGMTFASAVKMEANDNLVEIQSETGRGYSVELANVGSESRQIVTESSGARTVSKDLRDGSQFVSYEDGSNTVIETVSHPIWGQQLPVVSKMTSNLPSGLTKEIVSRRYADLATKNDPLSVTRFGHTISVSGSDVVQVEYVRSTKTRTVKFLNANMERKSLYNKYDQVVQFVTTASGLFPTKTAYNQNGLVSSQSQGNSTREFKYDRNGRIVEAVLEGNTVATFQYKQGEEKPSTMILASGRNYTFTYDSFNELETIAMPSGSVHRLISTVALGETTAAYAAPNQNSSYANVYDVDGDLILERYPSGKRVVRQRMDVGGRIAESSFDNFVVDYSYNDRTDRVSTIHRHRTGQLGIQSDMADDSDQILQPLVAPGTATISFQYDGGLVTRQSISMASDDGDDLSASFAYAYDSSVRLSSRTLTIDDGKQSILAYQYDRANRVTRFGDIFIDYSQPGVHSLTDSRLRYKTTFDGHGKIKERTVTVNGKFVYSMKLEYGKHRRIRSKSLSFGAGESAKYEYEYDVDGQLVGVVKDGATVERYHYDANGNRISWTVNQASYSATYNNVDQLTGFSGKNHYDVDEDGFLTRKRDKSYSYSSQGELTSIIDLLTGQAVGSYVYDGLNRRVLETSTTTGGVTKYLYGDLSNQHRVTHVVTATKELISLQYDLTGHLIAFDRDAQRYYVAADQVGTPWAVIDSSGTIVKRLSYTTYGVVLSDTNSAVGAVLGFAGGLKDSVAELVHFAYRDYDVETGRWTARDPSLFTANQPNLYQYVFNDPVNFLDPLGLFCIGGSFYFVVGGGAEICYENGRASICVEKGYGIGWDVGFDAQKKPSRSKLSVFGEAGASKGWLYGSAGAKIGGEYELSKPPPCEGRGSWGVSAGAAVGYPTPVGLVGVGVQGSYGSSGGSWSVVGGASGGGKTIPGKIGFGAQGKLDFVAASDPIDGF